MNGSSGSPCRTPNRLADALNRFADDAAIDEIYRQVMANASKTSPAKSKRTAHP